MNPLARAWLMSMHQRDELCTSGSFNYLMTAVLDEEFWFEILFR